MEITAQRFGELFVADRSGDVAKIANADEDRARLITAAPELFAGLVEAVKEGNHWHGPECSGKDSSHVCNCWVSRARAAIAKAQGQ